MKNNIYYDPNNLKRLGEVMPESYSQLKNFALSIHTACHVLQDGIVDYDTLWAALDLLDTLEDFTDVLKNVRKSYVVVTRQQFFYRIPKFHTRKTKVMIALALYDDIFIK